MCSIRLGRKKSCLLLLLLLVSGFSFSQTEAELLSRLEEAQHDSDRAKIYLGLHDAVFKTDIPKTKIYGEKIVEYARKSNNLQYELIGYRKLASHGRRFRDYDEVLHYDTLLMITAKKINTPEILHAVHMQLGTDYTDGENYAAGLYHLNVCRYINLPQNNDSALAKVDNRIGYCHLLFHQYTKSLPYFRNAMLEYTKLNDEKMIAHTKRGYADALLAIGKTDQVPEVLFDAINYYQKEKLLYNYAQCLVILSKAHLANGNFKRALENYIQAKQLFEENKSPAELASATSDIASFYLTAGNFKKAKEYGHLAQTLMEPMNYKHGKVANNVFWGQYYTMSGNLDSADYYFRQADRLAKAASIEDWQTENLRYWAVLKYKQMKKRIGDSLLLLYTQRIVKERDPAFIKYV